MARPTVEDVMSHRVAGVPERTPFKELVRLLADNDVDLVPVVDANGRVIGVVTTADLLARFGARLTSRTHRKQGTTAIELMTASPVTTTPWADVEDVARLAVHERVAVLPVVDQYGLLVGVVTLTELATVFLRPDEDIAREVRHEIELRPTFGVSVAVAVRDGVVALTGRVPTTADGRRLAEAVRRLPGVIAVHSEFSSANDSPRYLGASVMP